MEKKDLEELFDKHFLKLLSRETNIPMQKVKDAMITSDEWVELANAAARLSDIN